ncbi:hypothetical protein L9F63_006815, partial [Diploptera punctata]
AFAHPTTTGESCSVTSYTPVLLIKAFARNIIESVRNKGARHALVCTFCHGPVT